MDLAQLRHQPEEAIDLGRAALLLARAEYPDLDLDREVSRLDTLATEAAPCVLSQPDSAARVTALRSFLADTCGFHGNESDYYDPRNSFLNQVLDRRTGIPITLSVVYMEVGRRLGLALFGVGLPGHFLVKYQDRGSVTYLDPFHRGRTLTTADCREMVTQMHQGQMPFQEGLLAAVPKKDILRRMLNNLRGIYVERQQWRKALAILNLALELEPDSANDLRQRGLLYCRLGQYGPARRDLESYLLLKPSGPEADEVRQSLRDLKRVSAMLN